MKDKDISTKEEIESSLTDLLIKQLNENIKESSEFIKQNSGIIIAAAFSMIILLLSFIPQRSFLLEIGITFLVVSIIFQFELIYQIPELSSDLDMSKLDQIFKKIKNQTFLQIFSATSFYLGLSYLFQHFQIYYISFGLIAYLNIKCIRRMIKIINSKIGLKEAKVLDGSILPIEDLKIFKDILGHFNFILLIEIILESVIIANSSIIIMNWIFVIFIY